MKIGILTLHDSTNCGAVLQAYAMSRVYASLGHEAVLIDRRRNPLGWPLKSILSDFTPLRRAAWFLNASGMWLEQSRRRKTLRFLRNRIGLTGYHFHQWADAPRDLGVDLVSVGSDQVWNAGINDPLDYMPGRIPGNVPCIAYAASVGAEDFPEDVRGTVREALSGFRAVSVREKSSVETLSRLGIDAAHVLDPVTLAGRGVWDDLIGGQPPHSNRVFVYMLGTDQFKCVATLGSSGTANKSEYDFFTGQMILPPLSRRGHPRLAKNLRLWRKCRSPRVRMNLTAGPEDFVRAIAASSAVVTNSYHALLFATLYGKNIRYVLPDASTPQHGMMVRIRDYAGSVLQGPLLQPSLDDALDSITTGERVSIDMETLARRREESLEWLKEAL